MLHLLTVTFKLLLASLIAGLAMSYMNLSADQILAKAGLTPDRVLEAIQQGLQWAAPNVMLGAFVIVPLWCLIYILRPPRG